MSKAPLILMLLLSSFVGVILSQTSTKNPHGQIKWDCQSCHTSESWTELRDTLAFDHDETGFHLTGAHASAQCIGCHKDMVFSHVGVDCQDCHTDHHQGQLGPNCRSCHTPRDWQSRKNVLELHAQKGFALTGVHAVADCEACHRGHDRQEYAGATVDCEGCHAEAFAAATEPNHQLAGFTMRCEQCHHAASGTWNDVTYTHPSGFALTGAHKQIECKSCHATTFAGTPTNCYDCHSADFAATTDPNHVESGFTPQCAVCHSTAGWEPARYDHNATGFPLTGRHQTIACVSCHATTYAGTPGDCYSCHRTEYDATTNPNHALAGFSQDCATCHTTMAWLPATFDHNATPFPLTGAHMTAACGSCHATGYAGTPTACFACHQTEYDATTNPNHAAANFPTDCTPCHSTTNWTTVNWDHDALYFPIYTGAHAGKWDVCSDCHVQPANFAVFECTGCHLQSETDPKHSEVNDYQYLSSACYNCHPQGKH
ncbi:MAG: hypothetical protein AB1772_02875 [Candidatus Zixiibacteriota bacterium]